MLYIWPFLSYGGSLGFYALLGVPGLGSPAASLVQKGRSEHEHIFSGVRKPCGQIVRVAEVLLESSALLGLTGRSHIRHLISYAPLLAKL